MLVIHYHLNWAKPGKKVGSILSQFAYLACEWIIIVFQIHHAMIYYTFHMSLDTPKNPEYKNSFVPTV